MRGWGRALALAAALTGCAGFIQRRAADATYDLLQKSELAAARLSDVELAREAMPGGLLQLETFALAYPDHRGFRDMRATAVCRYALGFVFDDWEAATLGDRTAEASALAARLPNLLDACVAANLARLPRPWRVARESGGIAALLSTATRAEVPALRWIASADAVAIAIDPMSRFSWLAPTMAALARCIELAPNDDSSSAELLLGTLEAATGSERAASRFASARRALGEGALIVSVMEARAMLVARKDRAAFTSALERATAAEVTRWPERRLANELARRKAQRYLAAIDALIPVAP